MAAKNARITPKLFWSEVCSRLVIQKIQTSQFGTKRIVQLTRILLQGFLIFHPKWYDNTTAENIVENSKLV